MPSRRPTSLAITSSSSSTTKRAATANTDDEEILIPLLVARSCHLPGNSWCADWIQWFRNNHILFGICLRHPLHPLESWERCLLLAASVSFGLVATNIAYQLDFYGYYDDSKELINLPYQSYAITQGMVMLWTLGGVCHSIFDMLVWHIMACACCHPGGRWGESRFSRYCKDGGSYALIPLILALLAFAIFLVLLRASSNEGSYYGNGDDGDDDVANYNNNNNNNTVDIDIHDWRSFSFLSQYAIEVALAWFLYFPLVGTIVFSGILGCNGRLPILGGRPRDIKQIEEGRYGLFNQHSSSNNYASF